MKMRYLKRFCLLQVLVFSVYCFFPSYAKAATLSNNTPVTVYLDNDLTVNPDSAIAPYVSQLPHPIESTIYKVILFVLAVIAEKILEDTLDAVPWYRTYIKNIGKESNPDDSTNKSVTDKPSQLAGTFNIYSSSNYVGYGCTNNSQRVKDVQNTLNYWNGNTNLNVDGVFGAKTYNAIKAFQTKKGINPDGVVGPTTWKYLCADGK